MRVVTCQPQATPPSVAPCLDDGGTAYAPQMVDLPFSVTGLDYSQLGELFAFSVSTVLAAFLVGHAIGAIIRIMRS